MVIHITQDDINKVHPCSPFSCAVALAAQRQFPGKDTTVGKTKFGAYTLYLNDERFASKELSSFITNFDNGQPVKPRSIEVEPIK